MLMGTLKETLIFRHGDDANFYRYEIYKHEQRGGYFAMVYVSHHAAANGSAISAWRILMPTVLLTAHYLPNAKIECARHFNEQYKMSTEV